MTQILRQSSGQALSTKDSVMVVHCHHFRGQPISEARKLKKKGETKMRLTEAWTNENQYGHGSGLRI